MPDQPGQGEVARNPDWFLDRVDAVEERATFVRSNRERLAATLFLDGRTPFATGPTQSIELAALGGAHAAPARFIFHMSFCGSTQLSHLVGESGAGVVLKEPQALVDLADWQRALAERGIDDPRFDPALRNCVGLLSRGWPDSPPTLIKPSNWANTLIPALAGPNKAVLVTIDRRSFLRAVFRGGRDRLAFTARAASHFAAAAGDGPRLAQAIAGTDDALDQMARLVLLTHDLQQRLFDRADFAAVVRIDHRLISEDPRAALDRACDALDLPCPGASAAVAIERLRTRDAKNPGRLFAVREQVAEDDIVEQHHSERFDRALAWADTL